MADKDVQRNVRSSGEEGIQTPTEKHYHSLSDKDNFLFGERSTDSTEKNSLLAKFRERERKRKKKGLGQKTKSKQQDTTDS